MGKQGLALRGHRESLTATSMTNTGNFLETLKLLCKYDSVLEQHFEKIYISSVKEKKTRGRGDKLTFLSKDSQNKLVNIIGQEIKSVIAKKIKSCRAWALIADTTPDVTQMEQLSICVRIVEKTGFCSEHFLTCKVAEGTSAMQLYETIVEAFMVHCY